MAIVASAAAALFVSGRLKNMASGDLSKFVYAGSRYVHGKVPGLFVLRYSSGYDGQFYYRLARGPLDWATSAFGITMDNYERFDRVGYPALAWLASLGGRVSLVPLALVVVNVLAVGALAWAGSAIAVCSGRRAAWGLLIPGYWGFLWTLSFDLTELVAAACTVGALFMVREGRHLAAGACLSFAVLTREPEMVIVGAIAISWAVQAARVRRWPAAVTWPRGPSESGGYVRAVTWVVPTAAFVAWQAALLAGTGHFALMSQQTSNLGLPFVGFVGGVSYHLHQSGGLVGSGTVWQLVLLVVVAGLAGRALWSSSALLHEKLSWVGAVVLASLLTGHIWDGSVGFRSMAPLYVTSMIVLLFSTRRLWGLAVAGAALWAMAAYYLVQFS